MERLAPSASNLTRGSLTDPTWAAVTEILLDGLAGPGFAVVPGAFPGAFLDDLAREVDTAWQDSDYRSARVGRDAGHVPEVRSDRILWIDPERPTPLQARYLAALGHLREAIRRELYLPVHEIEAYFAVYFPGAFYRQHLDRFQQAQHRQVSCLVYLNRDWQPEDQGQLRLYIPGPDGAETSLDVYPEHGTCVCFLSDRIEHEVLPTNRPRASIAAWMRRRSVL